MEQPNVIICYFCGNSYSLSENEAEDNLPRTLMCGHIFCTSCLQSMECDNVIECPECEVESSLPEDGVLGLQEDARIIGLIYTAKMNKKRRSSHLLGANDNAVVDLYYSHGKPAKREFLTARSEEDIFAHLGLEYIEPLQRNA